MNVNADKKIEREAAWQACLLTDLPGCLLVDNTEKQGAKYNVINRCSIVR